MGFDPFSAELNLTFEGTRYDGAHIKMLADLSIADFLAFSDLTLYADMWAFLQKKGAFVSWDLAVKGKAVPIDVDPTTLPLPLVRTVVLRWKEAAVNLDGPLVSPSPDTRQSGEPLTETEAL